MYLPENGQVYVWGDNSEGQLGLGDRVHEVDTPTKLTSIGERVVRVACGYYHTAVVTGRAGCLPSHTFWCLVYEKLDCC